MVSYIDAHRDRFTGLPELQVDHPRAVPSMPMRQGDDPRTELRVPVRRRHIPEGGGTHAHHRQGASLAEAAFGHRSPAYWAWRFHAVRLFARHRALSDPQTEVPPPGLLGPTFRRGSPHIYSPAEITALLVALGIRLLVEQLNPERLRPLTLRAARQRLDDLARGLPEGL